MGTLATDIISKVEAGTGELINYKEVTTWHDGTAMTDAKADGAIYRKAGTKYYKLQYTEGLKPEWFGAKGDGSTNDTIAFQKLSAFVNATGGGKINFTANKTYIVGAQTFAGATGKGYAYLGQPIINITNCTKPVIIDGNGAALKFAGGLKFGSFDPVTGAVYNASMPFTNANYAADIGNAISGVGNVSISIKDIIINGNDSAQSIGGQWGDIGTQRAHYGIYLYNNESVNIENVELHHMLTDGIVTGYVGLTEASPPKPVVLRGVNSHHNARQGWSIVGGKGIHATDCLFCHTGRGALSSSPAAGVDIEAESSVNRDLLFTNCLFADNSGQALVADSGDSARAKFVKCKFFGTINGSIWVKKPGFVFEDCLISGEAYASLYNAADIRDSTTYIRCVFEPKSFNGLSVYGSQLMDAGTNAIFKDCLFKTENPNIKLGSSTTPITYDGCQFLQNGSIGNSYIRGIFIGENKMNILTGTNDIAGSDNKGNLHLSGNVLSSLGFSDFPKSTNPFWNIAFFGSNSATYDKISIVAGFKAPEDGTYTKGSVCFNMNYYQSTASPLGWRCVVHGSPGTWVPFGQPAAFQADSAATDVAGLVADFNALLAKLKASNMMV